MASMVLHMSNFVKIMLNTRIFQRETLVTNKNISTNEANILAYSVTEDTVK